MILSLIAPVALVATPAPVTPIALDTAQPTLLGEPGQGTGIDAVQPPAIILPVLDDVPSGQVAASRVAPVEARPERPKGDPLEGFNRAMYDVHKVMDRVALRPAAMGYKTVVPKPVRSGLRNILSNLTEPFVFLNFLLQGKPGKAAETFARFAVNSTLGVGGLIDVAKNKDFRLPRRNNGFGTTLAIYGVGPGPYLFLPFVGPTTLRDAVGRPADEAVLPVLIGRPFSSFEYQLATGAISGLDQRAEADPEMRALFSDAIDEYATLRSVYLQNRAAEIAEIRGKRRVKASGDLPELDDPLSDPGAGAAVQPSDAPEFDDPLADPARH